MLTQQRTRISFRGKRQKGEKIASLSSGDTNVKVNSSLLARHSIFSFLSHSLYHPSRLESKRTSTLPHLNTLLDRIKITRKEEDGKITPWQEEQQFHCYYWLHAQENSASPFLTQSACLQLYHVVLLFSSFLSKVRLGRLVREKMEVGSKLLSLLIESLRETISPFRILLLLFRSPVFSWNNHKRMYLSPLASLVFVFYWLSFVFSLKSTLTMRGKEGTSQLKETRSKMTNRPIKRMRWCVCSFSIWFWRHSIQLSLSLSMWSR